MNRYMNFKMSPKLLVFGILNQIFRYEKSHVSRLGYLLNTEV